MKNVIRKRYKNASQPIEEILLFKGEKCRENRITKTYIEELKKNENFWDR